MRLKKFFRSTFLLATLSSMLMVPSTVTADHKKKKPYTLQGACAFLPASRATEFHGNADEAKLLLGMAGNQWVVFDKVMQGFNATLGYDSDKPAHKPNPQWTLADLENKANRYYIQLVPPGVIRDQIKSGCLVLGNDEERNFLPGSVQVKFDVFASTNYGLMQNLAKSGFVGEAIPYIKNKLDLMVKAGNPLNIGSEGGAAGSPGYIADIVLKLLSPTVRVSQVDHVNEGIHRAINKMYMAMDEYIREHGTVAQITALNTALSAVKIPQAGSPSATRPDANPAKYNMESNTDCHYPADVLAADGVTVVIAKGTLRFCEFAVLNKSNTHETRVHHVETPGRILSTDVATQSDIGPVWTSELKYAQAAGDAVDGMGPPGTSEGVATPADSNPKVNNPATYSITVLATSKHRDLARKFIDYVRSVDGQSKYTDGGFIGLTQAEMDAGECYSIDAGGNLVVTPRAGGCD